MDYRHCYGEMYGDHPRSFEDEFSADSDEDAIEEYRKRNATLEERNQDPKTISHLVSWRLVRIDQREIVTEITIPKKTVLTWADVVAMNPQGEVRLWAERAIVGGLKKIEVEGSKVRIFFKWAVSCTRGFKMGTPHNDWRVEKVKDEDRLEFDQGKYPPRIEQVPGRPDRIRFGDYTLALWLSGVNTLTLQADDHLIDPAIVAGLWREVNSNC